MVANARPAYAGGIRAAIATVAPLLFDQVFGTGGGAWMSLAGLNGALLDRGGPYRLRAATMSVLALASAAAVLLGTLLSGHLWASVIVTFLLGTACGLARAWVDVGVGFGVTVLVSFAIALAVPAPTVASALMRALYILIGGLWALVLAIVVWPLRPYRPVRERVAACYDAIADYLEDVVRHDVPQTPEDAWMTTTHRAAIRPALEAARTALALSRQSRSRETGRGERLLVLHEIADQLVAHITGLIDILDTPGPGLARSGARDAVFRALRAVFATMRALADAIEAETEEQRAPVDWSGAPVREALADSSADEKLLYEQAAAILDRMADYADTASAIAATLNSGRAAPAMSGIVEVDDVRLRTPDIFSISAIVHPDSSVLHHALRVATMTALGVLVAGLLHLNHGYWVTLTIVVILQPYTNATTQKAMQRIVGTLLGSIVAALLSGFFANTGAVLVLIGIFTALCVALLPLNYGAYAVFGTPAFILLAEATEGEWHLAGLRVVNTLIGGALALAGSRFLWPSDERRRFPDHVARSLDASRNYLRSALQLVAHGAPGGGIGVLRDARRAIALAASNADESFQRLLGEHRGHPESLEPIMAFLVYTRRFAGSIAALAVSAPVDRQTVLDVDALDVFARAADEVLADLSDAVRGGRRPASFPPIGAVVIPTDTTPQPIRVRLNRLARQLKQLHDAVDRGLSDPDAYGTFGSSGLAGSSGPAPRWSGRSAIIS